MGRPTGLYREFRSRFDDEPIVFLIGLTPSRNRKTGPLVQSCIVRSDQKPHVAQGNLDDISVCGDCPLRPQLAKQRGGIRCHVHTPHVPHSMWHSWKEGRYDELDFERHEQLLARRALRLGFYGDPVSLPASFLFELASAVHSYVGYTHQWRKPENADYRFLLMASVESEADADLALALGWRYFRIREPGGSTGPGEFVCPAERTGINHRSCAKCMACNGAIGGARRANPVITVHGAHNHRRKTSE